MARGGREGREGLGSGRQGRALRRRGAVLHAQLPPLGRQGQGLLVLVQRLADPQHLLEVLARSPTIAGLPARAAPPPERLGDVRVRGSERLVEGSQLLWLGVRHKDEVAQRLLPQQPTHAAATHAVPVSNRRIFWSSLIRLLTSPTGRLAKYPKGSLSN